MRISQSIKGTNLITGSFTVGPPPPPLETGSSTAAPTPPPPPLETGSSSTNGPVVISGPVLATGTVTTNGPPPVVTGQYITNLEFTIPSGSPPPPPPYKYTIDTDDFGNDLTSALFILSGTLQVNDIFEATYDITIKSSSIKKSAIAILDLRGDLVDNGDIKVSDSIQSTLPPPSGTIFTNPNGEITLKITKIAPSGFPSGNQPTNFTLYVKIENTQ